MQSGAGWQQHWSDCFELTLHLCQGPADETQPDLPTPSDLHEETNVKEVLADHGREAAQQPEESGEAAQHQEQSQEGREGQEGQEGRVRQRHTENEVSEVDIPNVGRITVRADADGYNEEVSPGTPPAWLCPLLPPQLWLLTAVSFDR